MQCFCLKLNTHLTTFSTVSKGNEIIGFFNGVRRTTPTSTSGFGINALPVKLYVHHELYAVMKIIKNTKHMKGILRGILSMIYEIQFKRCLGSIIIHT